PLCSLSSPSFSLRLLPLPRLSTLSLHDALPISRGWPRARGTRCAAGPARHPGRTTPAAGRAGRPRGGRVRSRRGGLVLAAGGAPFVGLPQDRLQRGVEVALVTAAGGPALDETEDVVQVGAGRGDVRVGPHAVAAGDPDLLLEGGEEARGIAQPARSQLQPDEPGEGPFRRPTGGPAATDR